MYMITSKHALLPSLLDTLSDMVTNLQKYSQHYKRFADTLYLCEIIFFPPNRQNSSSRYGYKWRWNTPSIDTLKTLYRTPWSPYFSILLPKDYDKTELYRWLHNAINFHVYALNAHADRCDDSDDPFTFREVINSVRIFLHPISTTNLPSPSEYSNACKYGDNVFANDKDARIAFALRPLIWSEQSLYTAINPYVYPRHISPAATQPTEEYPFDKLEYSMTPWDDFDINEDKAIDYRLDCKYRPTSEQLAFDLTI